MNDARDRRALQRPSLRRTMPTSLLVCFGAWAASSCAPGGFQDSTLINSVRILASSADRPYAKPGSTVTLQLLAYDGRAEQPSPMRISWLPFVCDDPPNDAYYGRFQQIARGGAGGIGS